MSIRGFIGLLITEVLSLLESEKDITVWIREMDGYAKIVFTIYKGEKKWQLARHIDYVDIFGLVDADYYAKKLARDFSIELIATINRDTMISKSVI